MDPEDCLPRPKSREDSAYFQGTRDFRVMKHATYGAPSQGDMILKRLQEEHGYSEGEESEEEDLAEQHEQNVQSFAEPPPPEPEVSACSIDEN